MIVFIINVLCSLLAFVHGVNLATLPKAVSKGEMTKQAGIQSAVFSVSSVIVMIGLSLI